jgi:hypothetical protein
MPRISRVGELATQNNFIQPEEPDDAIEFFSSVADV